MVALLCCAPFPHPALAQDGAFDPNWGNSGRQLIDVAAALTSYPTRLLPQSDGKLLLLGTCSDSSQGFLVYTVCSARLLDNGSIDSGFGTGGSGHFIYTTIARPYRAGLSLGSGETLLLAGVNNEVNFNAFRISRLTTTGALDTALNGGTGYFSYSFEDSAPQLANALAIDRNGRVLVAGAVRVTRNTDTDFDFAVARLLPDLSALDPTFNDTDDATPPGVVVIPFDMLGTSNRNSRAVGITVLGDGSILVGGSYATRNIGVARVLDGGSLDATFSSDGRATVYTPGDDYRVAAFAVDREGRLLFAGSTLSGTNWDFSIARLSSDGTADSSFGNVGFSTVPVDLGGDAADLASALAVQKDGKILVAGSASASATATRFAVARVTTSGALDAGFGVGGLRVGDYLPPASTPTDRHVATDVKALAAGGILLGGLGDVTPDALRLAAAKLQLDLIYGSGFE